MLQISVVGPGLVGVEHINRVVRSSRCELHSIISNTETRIYASPTYGSLHEAFEDKKPDGVIISSPTGYHFEHAAYCLQRGVKCLIEKPLCANLTQAQALLEIDDANTQILVGHHRHHSSIVKEAHKLLKDNRLGQVKTFIASAQYYKPSEYYAMRPWRADPLVGGVLAINAIHDVGLLRLFFGEVEAIQAFGKESRINSDIYGIVTINFIFENGIIGTLTVSDEVSSTLSWEVTSGENAAFPRYENKGFAYIFNGTNGSLSLPNGILELAEDEPDWQKEMVSQRVGNEILDPLDEQLNHFLDVIECINTPQVGVADGYQNMRIIEAVKLSLAQRYRTVYLNEIFDVTISK